MVPKAVICEDCGHTAEVHSCGRIEYDWPKTTAGGSVATMPIINSIRLTIDCPKCGVKQQDFRPDVSLSSTRQSSRFTKWLNHPTQFRSFSKRRWPH
jgi:hypothetical protein